MPQKLIIAAVSARPFVQAAAAAGHDIIALDAFADQDTRRAARQVHRIGYADGRFDAAEFMQVLRSLDLDQIDGLAYGSGFEAAPALLEQAAQYVPLLGNSADMVRALKQPRRFFSLLDALAIAHPEVSLDAPENNAGWLLKHGGGSGGTHIRRMQGEHELAVEAHVYYQREVVGEAVSLLFAADGGQVRAIGYNRQWTAAAADIPYRYGGAVSRAQLPSRTQQALLHAAQQITAKVGLRGMNSLDALMDGDAIQVLEVNPRLSATFDLYRDADGALFDLHLRACAGDLSCWPPLPRRAKAQHIVYALEDLTIPPALAWPSWAADLPAPGSVVASGNPLCSALAEGEDAAQAQALAVTRAHMLSGWISA